MILINNRHIGRFSLGLDLFTDDNIHMVRKLLSGMVVIKADVSLVCDSMEYTAISDEYFEIIEPGCEASLYVFVVDGEFLRLRTVWSGRRSTFDL